jgi:3'-phosphoadenosine 5'-phosphosulfate sulfotransferase (PAPS reductase)/FAD synthetase
MLWRVLQSNGGLPDEAVVCFANTGKEDEATLKFVKDCQDNWNVKIVWLEYLPVDPRFKIVDFYSAARNGEPFEALITKKKYLPNMVARFCTAELKVLTIDRYLKSIGFDEYVTMVGIRADEPRRVAKMRGNKDVKLTPLADFGITEKDIWSFWNDTSFDLELPKVSGASNCDLCFLKGGNIVMGLIAQKPERAIWWAAIEEKIGGKFRSDRPSYKQMAQYAKDQMPLFSDESVTCFCGD